MIWRATWSKTEAAQGRHSIEVEAPTLDAAKCALRQAHRCGARLPLLYVLPAGGRRVGHPRYHRVNLREEAEA